MFAGRIKQAREAAGLDIEEVSSKTGLTVRFLADVEGGRLQPSFLAVERIVSAIGASFDFVILGQGRALLQQDADEAVRADLAAAS